MAEASALRTNMQTPSIPLAIKLTEDNFLLWKQQAIFAIKGRKLMKHIEENGEKLDRLNDEDKTKGKISEEYSNWEQQDQLLASWLLASMVRKPDHKNGGM